MSPKIVLILFALLETMLIFACVSCEAPKIQADLGGRAAGALATNEIDLGEGLVVDGRDAWLTGRVANEEVKAQAGNAVARIAGIRAVHNLLQVGEGSAPISTAPLSTAPAPVAPAPVEKIAKADVQRSIDDLIGGRVVEFESSSARLTQRGAALVDELAALLVRFPETRVEVAGHTDSEGTSRNNLDLSRRRADAVRLRMISAGVEQSRLSAAGYGEDRPIADNSTADGRLKNRRVELVVQ